MERKGLLERCVLAEALMRELKGEGVLGIGDSRSKRVQMTASLFLECFEEYDAVDRGKGEYETEYQKEVYGVTFFCLVERIKESGKEITC